MSRKKVYFGSLLLVVGCSTGSTHNEPNLMFKNDNKNPIIKTDIDYSGVYAVDLQGYDKYEEIAPWVNLRKDGDHYKISASFGCNTITGGANIENHSLVTVKGDDVVRGKSICTSDTMRKEIRFISILNGGSARIDINKIKYDNYIFEHEKT
ncbi:META domain-containing protein [Photobacterium kishitanii]|uniref:META domain-containing protein n=1 Tax=Photobacterium kishitanii TaxID=318456 RepID=UPI0007F8ABC2|nr:META domain-containing protein [Photobacterium kishitanii]OBU32683.1 hypothetical protein AYY23_17030 [Photobacterium kishitanii]PSW46990.1 META domain-containing protein [Photobacterium kishitanii]